MGGAQFGVLDGLLLQALQAAACAAALRLVIAADRQPPPRAWVTRWIGLTFASYGAAFILHIIAFALLGRLLPGEDLRPLRRLIVALVWAVTSGLTAAVLARRWDLPARRLGTAAACASAAAYAAFIGMLLLRPEAD